MNLNWKKSSFALCLSMLSTCSLGANVILPAPIGSQFYILPSVYGVAGDNFFLNTTFNSPNGNIAGGLPAVTITGLSTFTLSNIGTINQIIGGASGVPNIRAVVLAKAGATATNLGIINSININSAVLNTFGMVANSIQSGLPTRSAYVYNFGTITVQGNSSDCMNASGTLAARSYAVNYGTLNSSDLGVGDWVIGMSAIGNGSVLNETSGVINATSHAGSRGSSGLLGGYAVTNYSGTGAFSLSDPQMYNKGIITTASDSHGIYFWGDFQTFARNDGAVNVTGRGHGVYFDNVDNLTTGAGSAVLNALGGSITTNNNNSYGVYLRFVNNTQAYNLGSIQTLGSRAHGIVAYSPGSNAINLPTGSITVNGSQSAGIYYSAAALNDTGHQWNLGTIQVVGSNSFGIATPQSIFRNDGTITVSGANSFGMLAGGSYDIVPDSTIPNNTYLGGLTPLSANQGAAQTAVNLGTINATAALTVGLAAQGSGSSAFNSFNGIINATGTGTALLARSGATATNAGTINVGLNSIGMLIEPGSSGTNLGNINATNGISILVNNGILQNFGTVTSNTDGVVGTNNSIINNDGVLSGDINAVRFITGNNVLNLLNGSTTIGTVLMGTGADVTTVNAGANINNVPLFNGFSGASTLIFNQYDGIAHAMTGWQQVHIMNGAKVLLDGAETHSAGLFQIDNLSILGFSSQSGVLSGDINNEGILRYDVGLGGANYGIQGSLFNSGLIQLGGSNNIAGNSLTIFGDYIGQNGTLVLNTLLAGDNSPSDTLVINGGSATGLTGLVVSNTIGLGATTQANGILVVDAANGGTIDPGLFYLAFPAVAGPYEYYLIQGAKDGTNSNGWYLRSSFDNPQPGPIPFEPSDEVPKGVNIPYYSREVSLATAIPSTALIYDHMIVGTLHDRVGDQEQINNLGSFATRPYVNGMWMRVIDQSGRFNSNGIYKAGPSFRYYNYAIEVGTDIYHAKNKNGSSDYAGILGGFGQEHGNVDHLDIINAGRTNFNAWTAGGYYTHYSPLGWYIDTVLLNTYHDINANSLRGLPSILATGSGLAGSVEGGYNIKLPYNIGIEPEAQVVLERLWLSSPRDLKTTLITYNKTNSILGRAGARLTRTWQIGMDTPNIITGSLFGNIWHEFQGNSRTSFLSETGNIPFSSRLNSSWSEVGLSLTALVSRQISVFASGKYANYSGGHGSSGGGEIGLRVNL